METSYKRVSNNKVGEPNESESPSDFIEERSISNDFNVTQAMKHFNLGDFDICKLNSGRRRCRPRKGSKKCKFFDIQRKNKILRSLRNFEKISFPVIKPEPNLQILPYQSLPTDKKNEKMELAAQIAEVGELMGLISSTERNKADGIISNSL